VLNWADNSTGEDVSGASQNGKGNNIYHIRRYRSECGKLYRDTTLENAICVYQVRLLVGSTLNLSNTPILTTPSCDGTTEDIVFIINKKLQNKLRRKLSEENAIVQAAAEWNAIWGQWIVTYMDDEYFRLQNVSTDLYF
jgi:hypothetical protein